MPVALNISDESSSRIMLPLWSGGVGREGSESGIKNDIEGSEGDDGGKTRAIAPKLGGMGPSLMLDSSPSLMIIEGGGGRERSTSGIKNDGSGDGGGGKRRGASMIARSLGGVGPS